MSAGAAAQQPPTTTSTTRLGRESERAPGPGGPAGAADPVHSAGAAGPARDARAAGDERGSGAWARASDRAASSRSDEPIDPGRLHRDAAERVLRRAVQLDDPDEVDHRVSVQALLDAADELGIDRAEVRRAVVEEELGLLDDERRRADRLVGPERFVVVRVVDGRPQEVTDRVDSWMRRGRVLRRTRTAAGVDGASGFVEYSRRNDPVAGAQRALRAVQGSERLAHVRRVRVVVRELDGSRCVIGLLVDASRSRQNAIAGAAATTATGAGATVVAVTSTASSPGWVAVGAAASAVAGAGVMWSRKAWTSGVPDELESVLDAVESGQQPPSVIDGVTSRLGRPLRR